eukprot:TRINITY_DN19965_c0_g2_i1.p1 TRINITY_DN19965_c0_g2~~TRINITY_DN19965_c0_g2_i1.p1  ORF type:complete len:257 (+),score=40.79 TRINITY_DN19965_c0_g2_i1:625-1395(+)
MSAFGATQKSWPAVRFLAAFSLLWTVTTNVFAQGASEACASQPPQPERRADGARPPMAYCFGTVAGVPVVWLYGSIGPRSFEAVSRGLQQTARYREVWLNSPGGLVSEAFKIGLAFKRLGSTAVVPKHPQVHCVSACTIMILGAYNRTVEPGATFMIHAKSAFMNVDGTDKANAVATWAELAAHVAEDASRLIDVVQEITDEERASSTAYVGYVATALGGRPNSALLAQIASQPLAEIGRAVQQECRDRSRMPSSA